jgi:hypothetical protein
MSDPDARILAVAPADAPASAASAQVCLTLLMPHAAEDRIVDWLLWHADWELEFSVHAVAARGPLVHLAQSEERVQGFADRVELKLILERARLDALLDALSPLMAGIDGGWWVLPVERFAAFGGRMTQSGVPR